MRVAAVGFVVDSRITWEPTTKPTCIDRSALHEQISAGQVDPDTRSRSRKERTKLQRGIYLPTYVGGVVAKLVYTYECCYLIVKADDVDLGHGWDLEQLSN